MTTEQAKPTAYRIRYRGILTEMWVTGFSEPMVVDDGSLQRSVKASNRAFDARVFREDEIAEALRLTRRCFADAESVELA